VAFVLETVIISAYMHSNLTFWLLEHKKAAWGQTVPDPLILTELAESAVFIL